MEMKFKNDRHYEECVVQAIIIDHAFAEQMVEVLNVEYFNIEYLKSITSMIFSYYMKYKRFPNYKMLGSVILNEVPDGVMKDQMKSYMLKIHKDSGDNLAYVKENVLDYCRKRSIAMAMESALSLIEEKKYEQIDLEMRKALQAGQERNVGHEYKSSLDARLAADAYVNILPTPWDELNRLIRCGGIAGGMVGVIAALTGIGKSHCLVDIGAAGLRLGKTGVHYTLEDSDITVGRRYDANLSGVVFDNLTDNVETVRRSMQEVPGTLIIKSYPAGTASVMTLRNHYTHLISRGIKPDFILIDYAELLKAPDTDAKRFGMEAIYREIVAWADEIKIPIWTAAQVNRAGMDVEVITQKHLHECFAIAQISHLFITINRHKDGPAPEIGNMFICKSKVSKDGVKFPMMINTGLSRIEILPPGSDDEGGGENDDASGMSRLRAQFKNFLKKAASPNLN
jgi:replicative DNA helicase